MAELDVSYPGLALVILTPALCSFMYGVDLGVTSFVLSMLRDPVAGSEDVWWRGMASEHILQGLFVSGLSLGALIGSHILLVYLAQFIGRRTEIRAAACLYMLGTLLNVASGTLLRNSPTWMGFSCLLVGRLVFGCGVGFVQHGACMYMSEMCPASIRGAVVTAKEAFIVIGIIVGYSIGDHFSRDPLKWADVYASTIVVTAPVLIMSTLMPRSIRWLLMNGEVDEAKQSMQFIFKGDVDDQFETLRQQILGTQASPTLHKKKKRSIFSKSTRKAFVASVGLIVLQQFSGQPSIISYVTVLFSAAGLSGDFTIWMACLMACSAAFTVSMVDRLGRKSLLRAGCSTMLLALTVLSFSFWKYHPDDTDQSSSFGQYQRLVILVSLFIYISSYQLSYGPVTWLIVSEVFPLEIRGEATAFLVELNYCLNFFVQFLVPTIQGGIGWGPTFGMFACILALSIHFIEVNVPETNGMTLEAIEKQLRNKGSSTDGISERSGLLLRSRSMNKFACYVGACEDDLVPTLQIV